MNSQVISVDRGVIDVRKIFWFMVAFEALLMLVIFGGGRTDIAYFLIIVSLPLLLLFIPIEPVLGIPLMLIATGFDLFAQITKGEGAFFNLTYFHIIMFVTFASVLLNTLLKRKITIPSLPLWPPLVAVCTITLVTLLYTPNFLLGFTDFVRFVVLSFLALAMILIVNTKNRIKFVVWCFILIPCGVALFTIYEILTQGAFFTSQVMRVATALGIPVYRSTGTFHNPNDLACFLMVGISIGFAVLIMESEKKFTRIMMILIMGILSFALIASFSRGGWLSTFVAVVCIIILQRKWPYFILFAGLFAVTLVLLSIKFPHIILSAVDRLGSVINPFSEDSASSRISLIKAGIWMWQDHPIFGVGQGGFSYYAFDYIDPNMPRELSSVKEAHTIQARILAEQGLIGITIAAWFFFTVLFDGLRYIKTIKNTFLQKMEIGFVSLFLGFIANFTFASDLHNNIFWMTVGMIYAVPLVYENMVKKNNLQSNAGTVLQNSNSP